MLKQKYILVLLLILSCKTQEEIKREETIDQAVLQVQENQKLLAQTVAKLQSFEEMLAAMTGKIDEVEYSSQQNYGQKITQLSGDLELLQQSNDALSQEVEDQKNYTKSVVSTLDKLSSTQKRSSQSAYQQAMSNYKKGWYKTAKKQLLTLLNGNKIKGSRRARILHNLGMISFMNKNNEQAIVYFSKLFTEYPKSGYNKNGLLFLGKTFQRLDQKDKAKMTLEELLNKFPKAKQKKEAKKILGSLG